MKKKRVFCAMSGGVDSSVAAAVLKKQGYEVIGVFMKLWAEKSPRTDLVRENVCCSLEAATAARAVSEKLKIPFYVLNLEEEFKKAVVDYYIREYEEGRTPNPCVICNRDIKGEVLLKKVLALKADYLATGHYARVAGKCKMQNAKCKIKEYYLYRAKDKTKDQTYFLWMLKQKHLSQMLFPIGDYLKSEVRRMAKKWQLPTATRKESQGICFIPDRDICGFLRRHAGKLSQPGPIVGSHGHQLGLHAGLINYTIGQRERLGIGGSQAYYVLELKSKTNTLVVGEASELYERKLIAGDLNWINPLAGSQQPAANGLGAMIRYRHPIESCQLEAVSGRQMKVVFQRPQRAITPGQSIVFYQGEKVLGGGVIQKGGI
ncbi:MAG TPA: tRNA 2-thiouridine(34) synthase MnmA [Patescibacteria group bacterium]|nr:tRNA 2-thiouridine(34) synthase MnmA [Patescibacteria group bacterium]